MAQLSFVLVPSRANKDGSHQIRLKITNANTTAYLVTKFSVDKPGQLQNGMVIKHPMAGEINRILRVQLGEYEKLVAEIGDPKATASQIKKYLEQPRLAGGALRNFAKSYIERLKENGQKSYAQNMGYTLKWIDAAFVGLKLCDVTPLTLRRFEAYMSERGQSDTTINIRMTHLKALLNAAVNEGIVEYKVFPFRNYKMPKKNVRDICISKSELVRLRDASFAGNSGRRLTLARDLFMLSFYMAGINLTDLLDADYSGDSITFVRKKTAGKRGGGEKRVSFSIQPEARAILDKYVNEEGRLVSGYLYSEYGDFRSFVTKSLNRIGESLGFEKRLMFYSARKTFVQFGSELGIPLHILEYSIGHTMKEANSRPVFDYLKVMRYQSDLAIRMIIDYTLEPDNKDSMPLPDWARRR